MGPCCVEGCEITSEETYYFEFPTSRILRRKWLELIPIPGKLPLGTVVCSRHFNQEDYESIRGKVRLKRKVVPSLHLEKGLTTSSQTPRPRSLIPLPSPPKASPPPSSTSPSSPHSPPKETEDLCDSTTVSVPSPVDAEKMIDDIQRKISGSVSKLLKSQNGVIEDRILGKSPAILPVMPVMPPIVPIIPASVPPLDQKEDIEDMITNYHIKNKVPNPALLADLVPLQGHTVPVEFEVAPMNEVPIEIEDKETAPIYIEVSADRDTSTAGAASQDCLMVLESVQVEVDPSSLLLAHDEDYYREQEARLHTKEDPISLLTSSDEDDVILEEPHIDTVEVSDETDEDDMPLVKLVKKSDSPKKKTPFKKGRRGRPRQQEDSRPAIEKIMWGMYDFYCMQCHFSTKNSNEYQDHVAEHSKVLHVCQVCNYTSASKPMFVRHMRIHRIEKRFRCHLCDYKARHRMSLIYHLKKHNATSVTTNDFKEFKCKKCQFQTLDEAVALKHLAECEDSEKKHMCSKCDYATKKRSDLKRHCLRRHGQEEPDPEYI